MLHHRLAYGFQHNVTQIFVLTQPKKRRMSQVSVRRPLGEFHLRDAIWSYPNAVFHFFPCQSPLRAFFLWQINKRAGLGL